MMKPARFTFLLLPLFLVSACAMKNHSFVSNEPLSVHTETVSVDMPSDRVSRSLLTDIADDVKHRGDGDVTVTVHYALKRPLKATQTIADTQGARVKSYLQNQGVRRPVLVIAEPDHDGMGANVITIAYPALKAKGPSNCTDITHADADRSDHGYDGGYFFGCTDDKYLSEMIARPGDLLGNDTTTAADSQRLGKSLDVYRAGERATAKEDEGVSASNVYTK